MSVQSLLDLGAKRDTGSAQGEVTGREALAALIPSEPLAVYTSVTGITLAQVSPASELIELRWAFYGAFLLLIPVFMFVIWRFKEGRKRVAPWREMTAACLAFAAWGLVMPGSPLAAAVSDSTNMLVVPLLSVGAAGVLGLFGPLLRSNTRSRT